MIIGFADKGMMVRRIALTLGKYFVKFSDKLSRKSNCEY